ncbi:MAG TPA: NAD-dependent epimerase/dehydratase family protein [Thermoprotei archaeon]|nr:NAD-dependent epimerase/dehydratase family protein [Thermoprotei archaeon]
MRVVVTGGAGFIGSWLVDKLIQEGNEVIVVDNLSSGKLDNLKAHLNSPRLKLIKADLKKIRDWGFMKEARVVFHLAANPEVRVSTINPRIHFEENVLATFNVLEATRLHDVPFFVFTSSSTVYGDAKTIPTPEDYHPLEPISVYGASKLTCENFIVTYSKLYGIKGLILRLANIVGGRSTHGVIWDFIHKLKRDPHRLEILGDGTQRKSYLHVSDCVEAMLFLLRKVENTIKDYEIFNVGNEDWVRVVEIADIVVKVMGLKDVEYFFKPATPDGRGWKGDVKLMLLDISKAKSLGWRPRLTSREAVERAAREILEYISKAEKP